MARTTAENCYKAMILDVWPSIATIVDFGLTDQEHYEALYDPVRAGAITLEKLDEILGNGPAITAAVKAYRKNRYPNIVYTTPYDNLKAGDEEW